MCAVDSGNFLRGPLESARLPADYGTELDSESAPRSSVFNTIDRRETQHRVNEIIEVPPLPRDSRSEGYADMHRHVKENGAGRHRSVRSRPSRLDRRTSLDAMAGLFIILVEQNHRFWNIRFARGFDRPLGTMGGRPSRRSGGTWRCLTSSWQRRAASYCGWGFRV